MSDHILTEQVEAAKELSNGVRDREREHRGRTHSNTDQSSPPRSDLGRQSLFEPDCDDLRKLSAPPTAKA